MSEVLAVAGGGFMGAAGRYLVGCLVGRFWAGNFPLGTFMVNMLGSFALGIVTVHPWFVSAWLGGSGVAAVGIGFLGSFTTYSTFMYESFMLAEKGKRSVAVGYVVISIMLGLFLAWLAMTMVAAR